MNTVENTTLEDLGYTPFFETGRIAQDCASCAVARVIGEEREVYRVKNAQGEYLARVTGKHAFEATTREEYPAVGDWVVIRDVDGDHAVIHAILPRATILKRTHGDKTRQGKKERTQIIATNIDVAFVVESVDRDYSLNRFERYFAIAYQGGVKPAIVLNKVDLLTKDKLDTTLAELTARFPGVDICTTSTFDVHGIEKLAAYIQRGKTYCFLGSSGVGKSSLINMLLGKNVTKTGAISAYSGRGMHVTTARHMYFLKNGGIVIDNPGIREVGIADTSGGVDGFFDEISTLGRACRYADCSHTHEPGCAVRAGVAAGSLSVERYENYCTLKKEAEYAEMNGVEKREKDRRFGKFVKQAKKELGDVGY